MHGQQNIKIYERVVHDTLPIIDPHLVATDEACKEFYKKTKILYSYHNSKLGLCRIQAVTFESLMAVGNQI